MMHLLTSVRRTFAIMSGLFALGASASAAEPAVKTFDIPAGPAAETLKQFAAQSGREIVFAPQAVTKVTTQAVKGELTPAAALDTMLTDTGLIATQDQKTGAFAVRKGDHPNAPSRPVEAATAGDARPQTNDAVVQLDQYEVTSTRIDGLNNKGLLQGGANAPLYHDVVTRQDIERLGITSIEELFRLIPQTSSPSTALQGAVANSQTTGGIPITTSTMGLRGFQSGQTVILINGRALPRSSMAGGGGPDLQRIPMAAIQRVEILPYAGSAIYGAGAIGGAINIILRKEYVGKDLTTYAGTSTDGGAAEYRLTYVDGRQFNHGRSNLTLTFSYQHRDPLYASDRGYLERARQKFGPTSTVRAATGLTVFEQYILPAFAGAPATIVIGSSASASTDLGIPGAPGARYASIPAGTSLSTVLTPGSFVSTANLFSTSNPRFGRNVLYEPLDNYSLNAQFEHEFIKDRLSAYGEFTAGYIRKNYSFPQFLAVALSATDPLNPFRGGVTPGFVGRPVTVYLDTPDVPDARILIEYESARAVVGFKGKFSERWEWSADGLIDYTHNTGRSYTPTTNIVNLSALSVLSASAPAATRRLVYPLLSDHVTNPISASDVGKYLYNTQVSGSHGVQTEYNVRVTGDVWDLPAGPLRTSVLGKYQEWDRRSGGVSELTDDYAMLIYGTPAAAQSSPNSSISLRNVTQGALEVSIPVIDNNWRPIPIDSFTLQGSTSYEIDDNLGDINGVRSKNTKKASSNMLAGKIQLSRDVAFRASYSEGFFPPSFSQVAAETRVDVLPFGFFPDPKRGNSVQATSWTLTSGGNPNLGPERAQSLNYGVIITPRTLPGFTLSVDYWKIDKTDAITSVGIVEAWANPDLYAFAITRAAPSATDQTKGWLGVVTDVDQRPLNAASVSTEGIDTRLRYTWTSTSLGSLTFNANASFTNNFLQKITPTASNVDLAGASGPIRWRGLGSVTWSKGHWSTTVTGRYVGHYSTSFTAPTPIYPNAVPIDGGRIPAYLHWDLQAVYDIPAGRGAQGWRNWLAATRWTVGVNNALNEMPAYVTGTGAANNGSSFYSLYDDPRQRFVYVSVRKSL